MENIIVTFRIKKGGRFNNGGHKVFAGEFDINQVLNGHFGHGIFMNEDETAYLDQNGNHLIDVNDTTNGTGVLDFDGIYDTVICRNIEDCTDDEIEIIAKSNDYKSSQLEDFINQSKT
jgi:hypothetical protein